VDRSEPNRVLRKAALFTAVVVAPLSIALGEGLLLWREYRCTRDVQLIVIEQFLIERRNAEQNWAALWKYAALSKVEMNSKDETPPGARVIPDCLKASKHAAD
jgi:hypothetical protein